MSDKNRIYNYPKTSCNCYQCTGDDYVFPTGNPTNLSVRDCTISEFYDCQDRRVVGFHDSATKKEGTTILNPQAYQEQYATNFDKIKCEDTNGSCPDTQYANWDPRLYSATHNQYITFAHPPLESKIPLSEVYNKKLKGYGQGYKTYSDINAGNILYYIDKSREDPYHEPLFSQSARVGTVVYKDPMGAMKPEYPRIVKNTQVIGKDECDTDGYCLTWMRDTQHHREDMLSAQMSKINQQRWSPRWANGSK